LSEKLKIGSPMSGRIS
jgi:hypothetical protein